MGKANNSASEESIKHPTATKIQERGTGLLKFLLDTGNFLVGVSSGFHSAYGHAPDWRFNGGMMIVGASASSIDGYLKAFCRDFETKRNPFMEHLYESRNVPHVMRTRMEETMESPGYNMVISTVEGSLTSAGRFFVAYGLGYVAGLGTRTFFNSSG